MYYVIEYDGLRKIMDVKHDMQTELQNQRFPSALADLMKTGDMYIIVVLSGVKQNSEFITPHLT